MLFFPPFLVCVVCMFYCTELNIPGAYAHGEYALLPLTPPFFLSLFQSDLLWGFISAHQTWWKYNLLISSVNEFTYCLFSPCCPATIATSPVVNRPVRRHTYRPGILTWASLHSRCAERIRGMDLAPGSVPKRIFCQIWAFKTAKSIQSNCKFRQQNAVRGWNLLISWAKLLMKELMKWSQSC